MKALHRLKDLIIPDEALFDPPVSIYQQALGFIALFPAFPLPRYDLPPDLDRSEEREDGYGDHKVQKISFYSLELR